MTFSAQQQQKENVIMNIGITSNYTLQVSIIGEDENEEIISLRNNTQQHPITITVSENDIFF